jgi:NAD+ kinase
MRRIALVHNESDTQAAEAVGCLRAWCEAHECEVCDVATLPVSPHCLSEQSDSDQKSQKLPCCVKQKANEGVTSHPVDLVVALGGDGTILRAVHALGECAVPILGVKFGRLGFLSGAPAEELLAAVEAALDGRAATESRAMLDVIAWSGQRELGRFTALNEVLVGRSARAGIITTRLMINGHTVYTQRGDGLIAATATGSTAYALSAGGPILSPDYRGMALVPLASHTLVNRAIVTAPADVVRIELPDLGRASANLTVDGTLFMDGAGCSAGDDDSDVGTGSNGMTHVDIAVSERVVSLVKLDTRLFFDTLASEFFALRPVLTKRLIETPC